VPLSAPSGPESPADPTSASDGPLTATADSGISVQLEWTPIEGATGYDIEFSMGGGEPLLLASLDSSATTFEDLGVPEGAPLTYHLTPKGGGRSYSVTVATSIAPPNPYAVEPVLEEPTVGIPGLDLSAFDPDNFDPSTFDPSMFDPSLFDEDNFDPSAFIQQPGTSATIGPEGGELVAQAKTGVTYRLSVPAGALAEPTYIVMTPVETLNGYPFSGEVYGAVQIEPMGVEFDVPVRLAIERPEGVAQADAATEMTNVAFAFDNGGDNFHLTPFTIAAQGVSSAAGNGKLAQPAERPLAAGPLAEIAARQLESYGVGQAKPSEVRSFAKKHPPAGAQNRAAQKLAAEQAKANSADDEPAPLPSKADLEAGRIRLQASAAGSCKELAAVFAAYRVFYDGDLVKSVTPEVHAQVAEALANKASSILKGESKKCLSPQACAMALAEALGNPKGGAQKAVSDAFKARHPSEFARVEEMVKECRLEMTIDSTMVLTVPRGGTQVVMVTSRIPLRWEYDSATDKSYLKGEGSVKYVDAGLGVADCRVTFPSAASSPTRFKVEWLGANFDESDQLIGFNLSDWEIPGSPLKMVLKCMESTGRTNAPDVERTYSSQLGGGTCDIWCGYFIAARGYAREVRDWLLKQGTQGPGIVAEKAISQNVPVPSFDGTLNEKTVFTIRRVK
jgi:hypothetical protein